MKNILQKIKEWMLSVPSKYLWLFILGETLCLILGVLIPAIADYAIFFPLLIAFVLFFLSQVSHKDWRSLLKYLIWALAGTLIPQIFFWIA